MIGEYNIAQVGTGGERIIERDRGQMTISAGAMSAVIGIEGPPLYRAHRAISALIGRVEPPYPSEETERKMFYVGAMGAEQVTEEPPLYRAHRSALIGGIEPPYPSEETERKMFYVGAMGAEQVTEEPPLYRAHRAISALIGGVEPSYPSEEAERGRSMRVGYQSEEALLKEEYLPLERGLKFVPPLEIFEKIKKERFLGDFEEVLYRRSEKRVEPFRELSEAKKEVIRKLVDINLGKYMVDRVETFKKKEESESLQPKDVLEIFSIKKIAGETGWGDMLTEIKKIEKGYYKDCSTIPEMFEKTLRSGKAMTVKEAEDMLNRIYEFAEKHNISFTSPLIKNQIKILEMEMDL